MKKAILLTTIISLLNSPLLSKEIGKIIQKTGKVERSSIATGERFKIKNGTIISNGESLKTEESGFVEVLLNDGSTIIIKGNSLIYFISLRLHKHDPPTRIKVDYGKIMVTVKWNFNDRSFILTTPSSIISAVYSRFSIIVSSFETLLLVYTNKIGIANSKPIFKKAYILIRGEEISVKKDRLPDDPVRLPDEFLSTWFDLYSVSNDKMNIIRDRLERGIVDWILRKREY
jgi:FecR-like protein